MADLIDREMAIKDAESWVAVDEYEKHLQRNVIEWLKEFPSAEPTFDARDTQYNLPIGTDTISRQQAIDALEKDKASLDNIIKGMSAMDVRLDHYVAQHNQVDYDIDAINNLPSVEPQERKGKWISADAMFGGVPFYCSECGENTLDTVMGKPRWNFCPNCGARMNSEQILSESDNDTAYGGLMSAT